jgi:hypothetical protein
VVHRQLEHVGARALRDHVPLQPGRDGPVLGAQHVAARDVVDAAVQRDRGDERDDRLPALAVQRPLRPLRRGGPVEHLPAGLAGHVRHRRLTADGQVGLDTVAGALRQVGQALEALPVPGEEGRDVHQAGDPLGAAGGGLGDHHPAHAVAHQDRLLRRLREHRADPVDVGVEGDVVHRGGVGAGAGQVGGGHGVPPALELGDDRFPAPAAGEGAVDEDETGHGAAPGSVRGRGAAQAAIASTIAS